MRAIPGVPIHRAVHTKALDLQRQREDVILLSVGGPDFRTPEPIIDNAISCMRADRRRQNSIESARPRPPAVKLHYVPEPIAKH